MADDIVIPRATRELFDQVYDRLLSERQITSDREELALIDELLNNLERFGEVPDGSGGLVRVPSRPVNLEEELAGLGRRRGIVSGGQPPWRRFAPAIVMALVVVGVIVLNTLNKNREEAKAVDGTGTPTATLVATYTATPGLASATPSFTSPSSPMTTPLPTSTPAPGGRPTGAPVVPTPGEAPTVVLPDLSGWALPVQVELGGRTWAVVVTGVAGQTWVVDPDDTRLSWLAGSLVNRVFALPFTYANREFVQSIAPGAVVRVEDDRGGVLEFVVVEARQAAVGETDLLAQDRPGLVIVLAGEPGDARWVLRAEPGD